MLMRSRLVLGLCGLAMAAPTVPALASPDDGPPAATTATATQPAAGTHAPILLEPSAGVLPSSGTQPQLDLQSPSGYQPTPGYQPSSALANAPEKAAPKPHRHHGLFGWRHCVECQRARVKQRDGVDVPPPPSRPDMAGMAVQGEMVVTSPVVIGDPHGEMVQQSQEAGFAVAGPGGGPTSPGFAVVGEAGPSAEPAPIGVARGAQNPLADPRMAAMSRRPGAGSFDAAVVPSSIPAAPEAMSGPGHDRPHIISHVLGLPKLGRLRKEREEKERQHHAAIAYGDPNQKVTNLPASMVYSQGNR